MRTFLVLAAVLATLAPALAHADNLLEPPRARQGYYVSFGLGAGSSFVQEDDRDYGPISGSSFLLGFGQMITRRLGLGVAIDFGGGTGDGQEMSSGGLSVEGQARLVGNLAVHAGIGLGIVTLIAPDDDDDDTRGIFGASYHLALSYDWFFTGRRSGGWAVTPALTLRALPTGDDNVFGGFLSVQVSWWSGLPKNQLDLDVKDAF
jgi:hypothetical protein